MAYEALASGDTPALIVFLLDASGSMAEPFSATESKAACVTRLLVDMFEELLSRCMAGEVIKQRYNIGMIAYDSTAESIIDPQNCVDDHILLKDRALTTVEVIVNIGVPELNPGSATNTAAAFEFAETIIARELPRRGRSSKTDRPFPAPMICHLTDGEWTNDPRLVLRRMSALTSLDGNLLVSNIFLGHGMLAAGVPRDVKRWPGIRDRNELVSEHARNLFDMSSPLPASYAKFLHEQHGYNLEPGARMLFPAETPDLLRLAFSVAGGTPTAAKLG